MAVYGYCHVIYTLKGAKPGCLFLEELFYSEYIFPRETDSLVAEISLHLVLAF